MSAYNLAPGELAHLVEPICIMLTRYASANALALLPLQVYKAEASPVEEIFRKVGVLSDFEITGGIPETFPRLLETLQSGSLTHEGEQAA